jgi:hypothetical protein
MPDKLKSAALITGGVLAAMAIPAGHALAATTNTPAGPHPGLRDGHARLRTTGAGATAGSKAAAAATATCGDAGTITWQDRYDNRYLEVYHSGTASGNWVDAYPGNGTCTQHWYAVASGSWSPGNGSPHALYGMVDANSDLCLEAPLSNIGNAHVVQEPCGYSYYNYRWAELSGPTGWLLVQSNPTTGQPIYDSGVAACEDVDNHWVYTSHAYNVVKGSSTPKNCIWH